MCMGDLAALPLEALTLDRIRAWKGQLAARHAPGTVYQYLTWLSCVLQFGVDCDWLPTHPMAKITG